MPKKPKTTRYDELIEKLLHAQSDLAMSPRDDLANHLRNVAKMALDAYVCDLRRRATVCDKLIDMMDREGLIGPEGDLET